MRLQGGCWNRAMKYGFRGINEGVLPEPGAMARAYSRSIRSIRTLPARCRRSAVNRAARIMSLASGGQVLVSLTTEELLRGSLPWGARLRDLGEVSLKGLAGSQRVFDLSVEGLATDFASLQTTTEGNLPVPPTTFVGRADDIQRLARELKPRSLVTLVGVGGLSLLWRDNDATGAMRIFADRDHVVDHIIDRLRGQDGAGPTGG